MLAMLQFMGSQKVRHDLVTGTTMTTKKAAAPRPSLGSPHPRAGRHAFERSSELQAGWGFPRGAQADPGGTTPSLP